MATRIRVIDTNYLCFELRKGQLLGLHAGVKPQNTAIVAACGLERSPHSSWKLFPIAIATDNASNYFSNTSTRAMLCSNCTAVMLGQAFTV